MRPTLLLLLLITLVCCKKQNTSIDAPATNDSIKTIPAATATETVTEETVIEESEFDFMEETIDDWLKLGATEKTIKEKAGKDYTVKVLGESQVTGSYEEEWTFKNQGLQVVMESDTAESDKTIAQITITPPSKLKTVKGIGIGSSRKEIIKAYSEQLSHEEPTDDNTVIVGSVYGGIFFTLKDEKVTEIFIGGIAE